MELVVVVVVVVAVAVAVAVVVVVVVLLLLLLLFLLDGDSSVSCLPLSVPWDSNKKLVNFFHPKTKTVSETKNCFLIIQQDVIYHHFYGYTTARICCFFELFFVFHFHSL